VDGINLNIYVQPSHFDLIPAFPFLFLLILINYLVAFAIVTTLTLYRVVDLDNPKQGFVNLNATEQLMVNLKTLFTENH
jgi:hypothetical protein